MTDRLDIIGTLLQIYHHLSEKFDTLTIAEEKHRTYIYRIIYSPGVCFVGVAFPQGSTEQ